MLHDWDSFSLVESGRIKVAKSKSENGLKGRMRFEFSLLVIQNDTSEWSLLATLYMFTLFFYFPVYKESCLLAKYVDTHKEFGSGSWGWIICNVCISINICICNAAITLINDGVIKLIVFLQQDIQKCFIPLTPVHFDKDEHF